LIFFIPLSTAHSPGCPDSSATFLRRSYMCVFHILYSLRLRVLYSSQCTSKYHLRTLEIVVGTKRTFEARLSLIWLPWIVALLLYGIPLPKRLLSNLRPRPPISYAADHVEWLIMITSITTLWYKWSAVSWRTVMTWLSQEYPGLNPCRPSHNPDLPQIPYYNCSSCLPTTVVKLLGLYFVNAYRSSPLEIANTMAFFQSLGRVASVIIFPVV